MKMRSVSIRAIWKRPPLLAGAFVPNGVVPLPGIDALEGDVPVEVLLLLALLTVLLPVLINEPISTFRAVMTPGNGENTFWNPCRAFKLLTFASFEAIEALAALPDDQIDTRDMPEVRDWSGARRGLFFRPIKQQLTLRIDADVIAWFKRHTPNGEGYQTRINRALREYVEQHTDVPSDRS